MTTLTCTAQLTDAIRTVTDGRALTFDAAREVAGTIMDGEASDAQIAPTLLSRVA